MNTTHPHAPTPQHPTRPAEPARRVGYAELWRLTPAALGYLLPNLVFSLVGMVVIITLFSLSISLAIFVAGLYVSLVLFRAVRWAGDHQLSRLQAAGMAPIERPVWPRPARGNIFRQSLGMARNPHYWLYLLHGALVGPVIMMITWTVALSTIAIGLAGVTSWLWSWSLPADRYSVGNIIVDAFPDFPLRDAAQVTDLVNLAVGIIVLAAMPYIMRGLMLLHQGAAEMLLGRLAFDDMVEEIESLSASRSAAVSAENAGLRRLERDIHDGPQQRLIRLQMDLDATERMLDKDPANARALLAEARTQAHDTLEELRALSRGFAPPLLQDRGLSAALTPLVARNGIPTTLDSSLPTDRRLAPEVELGAYFVIAELLSNTTKHSGADSVSVVVNLIGSSADTALSIAVMDNGTGGAALAEGHGLSGLRERVTGLRGSLQIASPEGGPSTITVVLPLGE